jgi:hypothetical protein
MPDERATREEVKTFTVSMVGAGLLLVGILKRSMGSLRSASAPGDFLTIFLFVLLLDLQRGEWVIREGGVRAMWRSNRTITTAHGS